MDADITVVCTLRHTFFLKLMIPKLSSAQLSPALTATQQPQR